MQDLFRGGARGQGPDRAEAIVPTRHKGAGALERLGPRSRALLHQLFLWRPPVADQVGAVCRASYAQSQITGRTQGTAHTPSSTGRSPPGLASGLASGFS